MLEKEGIRTNMTFIFSANQGLVAVKAGASFISPFIGRLDDRAQNGMVLIEEIRVILDNYEFDCEIITAAFEVLFM